MTRFERIYLWVLATVVAVHVVIHLVWEWWLS